MRHLRALVVVLIGLACFGAGYFTNEYRNGEILVSIHYTDLLTDTRWRLTILDAINEKQYDNAIKYLIEALRGDVILLEQYNQDGKLGSGGLKLLEKARTHL